MSFLVLLPILFTGGCDVDFSGLYGQIEQVLVLGNLRVVYELNDGGAGDPPVDEERYSRGSQVITLDAPEVDPPTGTTGFYGWSTSPDGYGRFYQAGTAFTITQNTTLHALWQGDGTVAAYPKLVSTTAELAAIGATEHIALMADVTMTAPVTISTFKGTLDGRNHTVTLNITTVPSARSGLFLQLGDASSLAVVKNVHVTGSILVESTTSSRDIGGIAGLGSNATITNCVSSVIISASNAQRLFVGGIVGLAFGNGMTITNCYVSGSITTNVIGGTGNHAAGGIVGEIGLAAPIAVTIQKTVSLADITWADYRSYTNTKHGVRRIVGLKNDAATVTGTIGDNYALGTISMTDNVGPVNSQALNADYDGTAIDPASDVDTEDWWRQTAGWGNVWGGDNPTADAPWVWDAASNRPKLHTF